MARSSRRSGWHFPRAVIEEINLFARGWVGYLRLASVKAQFDMLNQWIRRRLRKILWEQWRKPKTRCRKLIALGLEAHRARKATATGLGAWWNAGASGICMRSSITASWPHGDFGAFSINIGPCNGPNEPPCTVPYARWCGGTGRATFPPNGIERRFKLSLAVGLTFPSQSPRLCAAAGEGRTTCGTRRGPGETRRRPPGSGPG
ncbi:MAG: hypothetical protein LJE63_10060 [Desulfobacteraceae bacterium]|nr:hypothetical protein [Desulfobacteraceae bacterium]